MKEYLWESYGQGSYLLHKMSYEDGGKLRRYVEYPLKDDDVWRFNEVIEANNGYKVTDEWNLTDKEREEIKNYIRNVLKPSDLYEESEEKKMSEMTVLSFGVPNDLVDELKSIVSRFEGVPVDTNFKGDQNPFDVAEIERLTTENENLKNDINRGHETVNNLSDKYSDAKDFITDFVQYQYDRLDSEDFALFFNKFFFSEDKIREYNLSEYVPERYKLTKVKAIQTNEIEIVVLQKEDDNYNADTILFNTREEEVEGFFDSYSVESSYEFEEKDTLADNLTKEQVMDRYSQSEIFTSKDCENIWY